MKHLQIYRFILDVAQQGSIRKSAERLHITPSALTRRIQDFEEEFGTQIFERLPQGMRLNAAGELLIRHIRDHNAQLDRLQSQVADLSGVRRGHVAIVCSQALAEGVVPDQIAAYRRQRPLVSFSIQVKDRAEGVSSLANFEADLALLLDPPPVSELRELVVTQLPVCAMVSASHPLAKEDTVRLRDCCRFPLAMPNPTLALRMILDKALIRRQLEPDIPIESSSLEFLRSYAMREQAVAFHVLSGKPRTFGGMCAKPIDKRDVDPIRTVLGQLRGRPLSTAAAKFADQLGNHL
ncbi:MAG: LysR family transcriptional regulator [Burkholderiaceae bacterium]